MRVEKCCTALRPPNEIPMSSTTSRELGAAGTESDICLPSFLLHAPRSMLPALLPRPKIPNLMNAKQSLRPQKHHADQNQRVNNQPVLIEASQRFRQHREQDRGQHHAGDRPAPAEHCHQHIIERALKTSVPRANVEADLMCPQ